MPALAMKAVFVLTTSYTNANVEFSGEIVDFLVSEVSQKFFDFRHAPISFTASENVCSTLIELSIKR